MSRNNTGNPIGSKAFPDFEDNVKNLDVAVNAPQDTFQDRLGNSRLTWAGMENQFESDQSEREVQFDTAQDGRQAQFAQLMISGGYELLGDYAAGIELTAHKQVVLEAGEFWRPAADTVLPYTTTGAGMPEGGAFVNIGDGLLRQDLVQPVATFNNVADMKDAGGLDVGRKARTLGYYEPGDGGGNDYVISDEPLAQDGGSVIGLSESGLIAKGVFSGEVSTAKFGSRVAPFDSTKAIQATLDYCGDSEKTCVVPAGDYWVSIAESKNTYACLVIPKGVHFKGSGKHKTHIQIDPQYRYVPGLLMANKGFDTELEPYAADGDITVSDMSLSDGDAVLAHRGPADLIAFSNCENVEVRNVYWGVADTHGLDLCGVKGARVLFCDGNNTNTTNATNVTHCIIQVDGLMGCYGTNVLPFESLHNSSDVFIFGCNLRAINSNGVLDIGHKPQSTHGLTKNIRVVNCVLDGGYGPDWPIMRCDPDSGLENIEIRDNIFIGNDYASRGIDLFYMNNSGAARKNITIEGNRFVGKMRRGFSLLAQGSIDYWPEFENIKVNNNSFEFEFSHESQIGYAVVLGDTTDCEIMNNKIDISSPSGSVMQGIRVAHKNRNLNVFGNNIKVTTSSENSESAGVLTIATDTAQSNDNYVVISSNVIYQTGIKFGIRTEQISGEDPRFGQDVTIVTKNQFVGQITNIPGGASMNDLAKGSALDNGGSVVITPGVSRYVLDIKAGDNILFDNFGNLRSAEVRYRFEPTLFSGAEQSLNPVTGFHVEGGLVYGYSISLFDHATEVGFRLLVGSGGPYAVVGTPNDIRPRSTARISLRVFI